MTFGLFLCSFFYFSQVMFVKKQTSSAPSCTHAWVLRAFMDACHAVLEFGKLSCMHVTRVNVESAWPESDQRI